MAIIKSIEQAETDHKLFMFLAEHIFPYFDIVKNHFKEKQHDFCDSYINVLSSFGRKAAAVFAKTLDNAAAAFQFNMLEITK